MNAKQIQTNQSQKSNNIVQQKYCYQCSRIQTPTNPLKSHLGPGWEICLQCMQKQGQIILSMKKNRQKLYPQIQMIVEGLYLGNEDAACDQQTIQKHNIRAICTCGSYLLTPFENKQMPGEVKDMHYVRYNIADFYDQQISKYFDDNCSWIDKKRQEGRNVLVHCAAGVSRSASFTIAYLMNRHDMDYLSALAFVKQKRKVINPNSGFRKQLQEYEKNLLQRKKQTQKQQEKTKQ